MCLRKCPTKAIVGGKKQVHVIEQERCTNCGTCLEVCPARFDAVRKLSGVPVPPPVPVDQRAVVSRSKDHD
jgi:NADH-quinone oxidoreductase subunit F